MVAVIWVQFIEKKSVLSLTNSTGCLSLFLHLQKTDVHVKPGTGIQRLPSKDE
jgi:hypothetical protein